MPNSTEKYIWEIHASEGHTETSRGGETEEGQRWHYRHSQELTWPQLTRSGGVGLQPSQGERQKQHSSLSSQHPLKLNPVKGVHSSVTAAEYRPPLPARRQSHRTANLTPSTPGQWNRVEGAEMPLIAQTRPEASSYKQAALGTRRPGTPLPGYTTVGVVPWHWGDLNINSTSTTSENTGCFPLPRQHPPTRIWKVPVAQVKQKLAL